MGSWRRCGGTVGGGGGWRVSAPQDLRVHSVFFWYLRSLLCRFDPCRGGKGEAACGEEQCSGTSWLRSSRFWPARRYGDACRFYLEISSLKFWCRQDPPGSSVVHCRRLWCSLILGLHYPFCVLLASSTGETGCVPGAAFRIPGHDALPVMSASDKEIVAGIIMFPKME